MKTSVEIDDDESLMAEYQQGDFSAFERLYQRYSGRVYGHLRKKCRNQGQADDVFQITFMKLHLSRSTYKKEYPFRPWLFSICQSALVDYWRKNRNNDMSGMNNINDMKEEFGQESQENVQLDLSELPERQRMAVEYRYFQEYSFEEVAKRLKTTPVNARQILSRAIKKLKSNRSNRGRSHHEDEQNRNGPHEQSDPGLHPKKL